MKRCMLCHWLLQKRRWLLLPIVLALSLLLAFIAPTWLWLTLCAAVLLVTAMLLIYLRDLRTIWSNQHLRMPSPRDGQAEIVMVDAALVDRGPAVLSAAQPIAPVAELSMRMGSGALLLGAAMIHLADSLPRADRSALLAAAEQLNLHEAVVRQKNPVLSRRRETGLECVTVRDGADQRSYFAGSVTAVLDNCGAIWDERVRLMSAADRSRIRTTAREMAESCDTVYAFATSQGDEAPVFLGLAAIGDALDHAAIAQLRELRSMGLTLILRDDGTRLMDVESLRRSLDIPDLHARPDIHLCIANPYPDKHCLAIVRHEDRALAAPVRQLREHFSTMSFMLQRLFGLMGLSFLCCIFAGGVISVPVCAAILTAAYLSFGSLTTARAIRPVEAAISGVACLLIRLLLNAAAPEAADAAGTCLCLAFTALLSLRLAVPGKRLDFKALLPMLIAATAALILQMLIAIPVMPSVLLPAAFCIVCGAAGGLVFLITGH